MEHITITYVVDNIPHYEYENVDRELDNWEIDRIIFSKLRSIGYDGQYNWTSDNKERFE